MDSFTFFENLYFEMNNELLNFIHMRIGDINIAEDILQDAFVECFHKLDEVQHHPSPRGWMFCTTKYKLMKALHERMRLGLYEILMNDVEQLEIETVEDVISRVHLFITLKEILNEDELRMIDYYCLKGFSSGELASYRAVSDSAIRMSIKRIKKRIRMELEDTE